MSGLLEEPPSSFVLEDALEAPDEAGVGCGVANSFFVVLEVASLVVVVAVVVLVDGNVDVIDVVVVVVVEVVVLGCVTPGLSARRPGLGQHCALAAVLIRQPFSTVVFPSHW